MYISIHNLIDVDIKYIKNIWIVIQKNSAGPIPAEFYHEVSVDSITPDYQYFIKEDVDKNDNIRLKIWSVIDGKNSIKFIPVNKKNINTINIFLPQYILDQKDNIHSLEIKIKKSDSEIIIPIKRIDACVQLDAADFDDHDELEFCITYKFSKSEKISSLNSLIMHPTAMNLIGSCIRHNTSDIFLDTNKGRLECLSAVDNLITKTLASTDELQGAKNLLYFSVYFDKGYVELMNNSLMSIIKHSTVDFDVLIIADEATQKLIAKQPFTQHIQPKYHITPTPIDGVEASKNKTLIYDYAGVDAYDKILFLDCDVVAVGDIAEVFAACVDHNKLYTAKSDNMQFHHHRSFHHGFDVIKQEFIDEMTKAKQYPFNAGQFMFRNSSIMREHFSNLNWFMKAWSGEYFFEQAFMCYYFSRAKITDSALNSKLALISTVVDNAYSLQGKILLHFTAPPLDAITKINYINQFIEKNYQTQYE
jgi:hypothetical protein